MIQIWDQNSDFQIWYLGASFENPPHTSAFDFHFQKHLKTISGQVSQNLVQFQYRLISNYSTSL